MLDLTFLDLSYDDLAKAVCSGDAELAADLWLARMEPGTTERDWVVGQMKRLARQYKRVQEQAGRDENDQG